MYLKKTLLIVLLSVFCVNISAQEFVRLKVGKTVSCKILDKVTNKSKTPPSVIVDKDVRDVRSDIVIIKAGTPVKVDMFRKKHNGPLSGSCFVEIKCLYTTAVDGQRILLDGGIKEEGDGEDFSRATVAKGYTIIVRVADEYEIEIEEE